MQESFSNGKNSQQIRNIFVILHRHNMNQNSKNRRMWTISRRSNQSTAKSWADGESFIITNKSFPELRSILFRSGNIYGHFECCHCSLSLWFSLYDYCVRWMEMAIFIELKLKAFVLALLWEKDSKAAKVSSNSHFQSDSMHRCKRDFHFLLYLFIRIKSISCYNLVFFFPRN